jgi:hypothetical protein
MQQVVGWLARMEIQGVRVVGVVHGKLVERQRVAKETSAVMESAPLGLVMVVVVVVPVVPVVMEEGRGFHMRVFQVKVVMV